MSKNIHACMKLSNLLKIFNMAALEWKETKAA